jgi:hypothetical protein
MPCTRSTLGPESRPHSENLTSRSGGLDDMRPTQRHGRLSARPDGLLALVEKIQMLDDLVCVILTGL